ncbi:MAG: recombination mediator RecR [Desulfovibrionaceae bacterium]
MPSTDKLPAPLRRVVEHLSRLPGLGPKSALRIGLELLNMDEARARDIGASIAELRDKLCMCRRCASLAESSPCAICSDPTRDDERLCLVSGWDTLLALEEVGVYRGRYLVLGGLLDPLESTHPHQLQMGLLLTRLREGQVRELILALGSTLEAENTASYIKNLLKSEGFSNVALTRLAQGIPMGAEVKYMDQQTLKQSLLYRQDV